MTYLIERTSFLLLIFLFLISCSKEEYYSVKEVVITFDDAPAFPENTGKILDVLKKHKVKATFFCVGRYLKECPDLAYRIAEEQFMGNHTYSHISVKDSELVHIFKREILQTQHIIDSLQPTNKRYFRPPYSKLSLKQKLTLLSNGFDVVMWDLSAEEWNEKVSAQNIIDYFHHNLNSVAPIPIILFHPSNSTVEALDVLLTEFEEKNISVITLDDYKSR
jgi:peptidoglycan/xylan/chitin deacetylase (PgdA/CDA1 family)